MREKLRLSDLNILYICLSSDWGTLERRCLADASYFRNIGGSAFIVCQEKSILDVEAEKEDLPRLHFSGDLRTWRSKLNFYLLLQQIMLKQQFDIIHSYNYDSLLPLGMVLKRQSHIPLIFTFNENVDWKKNSILDRLFLARTDLVLTFSPNIKDLAAEVLPLSYRKINVIGLGVEFQHKHSQRKANQEKKKILVTIPRKITDLETIKLLMDSINPLRHQMDQLKLGQDVIFTLLSDINWLVHPDYETLKRMVLERGLEMMIRFENKPLTPVTFFDYDLVLGLPVDELFSDQDLLALSTETPVLLPRTSTRQQMVLQGRIGETYFPEDSRELKDKILKILMKYHDYQRELASIAPSLRDQHHFERYAEDLYQNYEKLYSQRLRYSQKKKRLW
jgi:glycosyltransferase involved in cell wall biosynthesis